MRCSFMVRCTVVGRESERPALAECIAGFKPNRKSRDLFSTRVEREDFPIGLRKLERDQRISKLHPLVIVRPAGDPAQGGSSDVEDGRDKGR